MSPKGHPLLYYKLKTNSSYIELDSIVNYSFSKYELCNSFVELCNSPSPYTNYFYTEQIHNQI